jgi:hypothetical protein
MKGDIEGCVERYNGCWVCIHGYFWNSFWTKALKFFDIIQKKWPQKKQSETQTDTNTGFLACSSLFVSAARSQSLNFTNTDAYSHYRLVIFALLYVYVITVLSCKVWLAQSKFIYV